MRRHEKEIRNENEIETIIRKAHICRLGLSDGDQPYIVPMCFGYDNKTLYFHGAGEGKKIDILKKNQNVCFEIDIDPEIVTSEDACKWGVRYQSVIGFGRAFLLNDNDAKLQALKIIMLQYTDRKFQFMDMAVQKTTVIKVVIESMAGKQSG